MLLTVEQTLLALETGDPVPPRAARLAVAVLRHAYAELACGVEKAIGECGTDEWAMARLGGYHYESEEMLSDPVAMYSPAANILPALLACRASAREKSSEGTAQPGQRIWPIRAVGGLPPAPPAHSSVGAGCGPSSPPGAPPAPVGVVPGRGSPGRLPRRNEGDPTCRRRRRSSRTRS